MIRAREWIQREYQEVLDAHDYHTHVQPNSLDLCISSRAVVFDWPWTYKLAHRLFSALSHTFHWDLFSNLAARFAKRTRVIDISRNGGTWLRPGQMALLASDIPVHIPLDTAAFLTLKSSRGREGFDHALAGFFDSGFTGDAVFEVYAHAHPVLLKAGMPFAQLIFMRSETPGRGYDGHYQGQKGPTISWTEETK